MKRIEIIALSILLLGSCRQPEQTPQAENKATPVKTVTAVEFEYRIPIRATGLLATAEQMKLSFKTGGIIQTIVAREGVNVKKGEELARLDLSEIRAQVEQAQISYEKAGRDLERAENLYRDSVVTLEQYQDARSGYELARSRKQIAEFNLQHSVIKAPADGKVQKVMVENSELIAPGYPAIMFASTESEWVVRASITDKDIVKLSIGDTGWISMDAFPELKFRGEVSELASFADPVSGTYEVEIILPDGHPQFRTGFISRAEILPAGTLMDVVVPVEALQDASDRNADVFVYSEGIARKRKIRIGRIIDNRVVVREGLLPGEEVITAGAPYLSDGAEVEKMEDRP
jgi:RND family efflux transporter MFP subunit